MKNNDMKKVSSKDAAFLARIEEIQKEIGTSSMHEEVDGVSAYDVYRSELAQERK